MYLSRVEIDIENRRKIRDLTHLGAFHSWVEESFDQEIENGERSRKLWRIDEIANRKYLLLLSEEKPNLKSLEKYGVEGSAQTKDYQKYIDSLEEGMKLRFKIKLNPVIRKSRGKGNKGPIVPLVSDQDQMKFLIDRSEKNGFKLGDFIISEKGYDKLKQKKKRDVNVVKAIYQGELTITDLHLFKEMLKKGIGRKKAYGFGMMTVII